MKKFADGTEVWACAIWGMIGTAPMREWRTVRAGEIGIKSGVGAARQTIPGRIGFRMSAFEEVRKPCNMGGDMIRSSDRKLRKIPGQTALEASARVRFT